MKEGDQGTGDQRKGGRGSGSGKKRQRWPAQVGECNEGNVSREHGSMAGSRFSVEFFGRLDPRSFFGPSLCS